MPHTHHNTDWCSQPNKTWVQNASSKIKTKMEITPGKQIILATWTFYRSASIIRDRATRLRGPRHAGLPPGINLPAQQIGFHLWCLPRPHSIDSPCVSGNGTISMTSSIQYGGFKDGILRKWRICHWTYLSISFFLSFFLCVSAVSALVLIASPRSFNLIAHRGSASVPRPVPLQRHCCYGMGRSRTGTTQLSHPPLCHSTPGW